MEIYVKIAACGVVCALLCAVLKPHEGALALAVSVLAAAGAAVAALGLLSPVLEFFESCFPSRVCRPRYSRRF